MYPVTHPLLAPPAGPAPARAGVTRRRFMGTLGLAGLGGVGTIGYGVGVEAETYFSLLPGAVTRRLIGTRPP